MKPAWHGGNKIPNSYLAKFMPKQEHEDLPHELRVFMDEMGADNGHRTKTAERGLLQYASTRRGLHDF